MPLYKVLKPGVHQRNPEGGFTTPKVGDIIKVSDIAAPRLIEKGFIGPTAGSAPDHIEHESRRERRKRLAMEEAKVDAPETPPAEGKGGDW